MKNNVLYGSTLMLLLLCECFAQAQNSIDISTLWCNNFRVLSPITIGLWYYQTQKNDFRRIHKLFLVSLLLPIIVSFSSYLLLQKTAILINTGVNTCVFGIWIYCFHSLGARISVTDADNTLTQIYPAFFAVPILFYFLVLFPEISGVYAVIALMYIIVFSYVGILSAFLPIDDEKKRWLVLGVAFLMLASIINSYNIFVQKIVWVYPAVRIITIISKYMIVFGMMGKKKNLVSQLITAPQG